MSIQQVFNAVAIRNTINPALLFEALEEDQPAFKALIDLKHDQAAFTDSLQAFIDNNF